MPAALALDLEKQLRFYGAYHRNAVNVGIHGIFVPLIMFTFWTMSGIGPELPLPDTWKIRYLEPNPCTLFGLFYTTFYILLEPVAGALAAPFMIAAIIGGNYLRETYGWTAVFAAAALHIVSWIFQFIGHGVFEGRKPSLFNSMLQSFVMAGLFVWMEMLFKLGYRPGLKARLDKVIAEDRANMDRADGKTARPVTRSQTNGTPNGKSH